MTQTTNWIGVDVCQDWLDVHILATGEIVRQANTTAGIAALIQAWQPITDIQVVLESTGRLERPFVKALQTAAIAVSMVNPMKVAEKNRLSRAPVVLRADIKAHIKQLEERIEQLNQQCLAELPEFGQLSDKEIARLVGVAPLNQDSGQHRGKRMIQGGRTTGRCGYGHFSGDPA
jgi:transposase